MYRPKSLPLNDFPDERLTLALGAFGPSEDFFTVKGALEGLAAAFGLHFAYQRAQVCWLHPGISAEVLCNGKKLGVFGKLANEITGELKIAKDEKDSQNIYLAELDWKTLAECFAADIRYQPISAFTPAKRDIAVVCDEAVSCGELTDTIRSASKLVQEVQLFDIYRSEALGKDKKSMAFSLVLAAPDKELEPAEVDRAMKKIVSDLKFKKGAEMR